MIQPVQYTIYTTSATDFTVYVTSTSQMGYLHGVVINNLSAVNQRVRLWNVGASTATTSGSVIFDVRVLANSTDAYNREDLCVERINPHGNPQAGHRSPYIFTSGALKAQFDSTGTVALQIHVDEE